MRWVDPAGIAFNKTLDGSGILEDGDATITASTTAAGRGAGPLRPLARGRELTPDELAEPLVQRRTPSINTRRRALIWQPAPASWPPASSTTPWPQTMLPPDSNLLGLDAARLPPDGRALIYRVGMLALIHNTAACPKPSCSPPR